mmetsp:Transcript_23398/g.56330  ORF Transcript_23398/g.56330 Transcript_23398/m.56330 type:complete len:212 (+) Transcript_23398:699-1334(+)
MVVLVRELYRIWKAVATRDDRIWIGCPDSFARLTNCLCTTHNENVQIGMILGRHKIERESTTHWHPHPQRELHRQARQLFAKEQETLLNVAPVHHAEGLTFSLFQLLQREGVGDEADDVAYEEAVVQVLHANVHADEVRKHPLFWPSLHKRLRKQHRRSQFRWPHHQAYARTLDQHYGLCSEFRDRTIEQPSNCHTGGDGEGVCHGGEGGQ